MIDSIKNYIEKRIQLVKLEMVGIFANMASGLVSGILILIFLMLITLMLTFALAFLISNTINSFSGGFAIVAGIYAIFFIIYLIFIKDKMDIKIKDAIVDSALNTDNKIETDNTQIDD